MKMAASATPDDRQRVETMMAQRRTLNPNVRRMGVAGMRVPQRGASNSGEIQGNGATAASTAPPKPAWQQLREQGIEGQGSAAANKAALAGTMTRSGPIMDQGDPMRPGGGMAPRPMTPEMVAQAQGQPGGMGERSGAKPGQPMDISSMITLANPAGGPPLGMGGGDQMSVENQDPGIGWTAQRMAGAQPGGGGFEGPGGGMPPGMAGGLPPEIMQRLQAMRMPQQGGAPGMPSDPAGGRGFVPPGQGAGAPGAAPRPYGLQSFYGA